MSHPSLVFVSISPCIFLCAASLSHPPPPTHPLTSSASLALQLQGMTHILILNFNISPLLQAAAPKTAQEFVYIQSYNWHAKIHIFCLWSNYKDLGIFTAKDHILN